MATSRRSRLSLSAIILCSAATAASALPPPLPPINRPTNNPQQRAQQRAPQRQQAVKSNAHIVFDKDEHDFGRIFDHEKQDAEFYFSNKGTEALVIDLVKPTCGCTLANIYKITDTDERVVLDAADPESMTFEPEERGLIDIVFNPSGKHGQQNKKINIFSNDRVSHQRSVAIKGFVRAVVQIDPGLLSFGNLDVGQSATKTIRLMGILEGFEASRPTFAKIGSFEAKVISTEQTQFQGDTLWATTIEVTAPATLKPGTYNTTMHVRTNDDRKRIVDVPVFVAVKGPIEVVPPRLAIGNIRVDQPVNRSFLVRSRNGKSFEITDLTLDREDLAGLEFTATPRTEGDLTQYVVKVSGTISTPMARTNAILKITTNLEEHNVLELPLILGVTQ